LDRELVDMKNFRPFVYLFLVMLVISCKGNNENEFKEVNSWIKDSMEENYLWNERVPDDVNGQIPPGAFFGSMLDPNDYMSYIVNSPNYGSENSQDLTFKSGVSPAFGSFSNSSNVFIVVEYVHPNSSADTAGLKRGDIILEIDETTLTTSNYLDLFYSNKQSITYSLGQYNAEPRTITLTDDKVTVEQQNIEFNPVVYQDVIEQGNKKIGYLFYSEFINGENDRFIDSVEAAMQEFLTNGITDLIVDLRYNSGGSLTAAENLANALVSPAAIQNEEILVRFKYNDNIEEQIINEEGEESPNLIRRFSSDDDNLGLESIYFLTSGQTSGTSELIINGLIPHMNVKIIGGATNGELFGSMVINGENATPSTNYTIVPTNLRYENSEENSEFIYRLTPDIQVTDNLFEPKPIGDVNDPLLSTAIQSINGSQASAKTTSPSYELLPDIRAERKGRVLFSKNK
jgi:C-terminal processing protease CtpA/Prc